MQPDPSPKEAERMVMVELEHREVKAFIDVGVAWLLPPDGCVSAPIERGLPKLRAALSAPDASSRCHGHGILGDSLSGNGYQDCPGCRDCQPDASRVSGGDEQTKKDRWESATITDLEAARDRIEQAWLSQRSKVEAWLKSPAASILVARAISKQEEPTAAAMVRAAEACEALALDLYTAFEAQPDPQPSVEQGVVEGDSVANLVGRAWEAVAAMEGHDVEPKLRQKLDEAITRVRKERDGA